MKQYLQLMVLFLITMVLGCASQTDQQSGKWHVPHLTIGAIQKEIHTGMSGSQVVETIGSPNVVTKDGHQGEEWVFDNISTNYIAAQKVAGTSFLKFGLGKNSSNAPSQQKNLTVLVKFGKDKKVQGLSYRTT